jgi:hypothetical protein
MDLTNSNNIHCTPVQRWPGKPKEFIVVNDGDTMNYALATGVLTIDNNDDKVYPISWYLIDRADKVKVLCPSAAVAQVDTITTTVLPQTFTALDEAKYSITLEWEDADTKELQVKTYTLYFATSTTWTEATFTAAFIAKINADPDGIVTASASSNHLRLTADTAGQWFLVKFNSTYHTISHTTANVVAFGLGSDLIDFVGFTTDDGVAVDNTYIWVEIPYYTIDTGDLPTFNRESGGAVLKKHRLVLLIEEGGTAESSTLGTTISTNLCAILSGAATASKYFAVVSEGCPCS